MINILIRTSNRPKEFTDCICSIYKQTYKDVQLIICTDSPDASMQYILENTRHIPTKVTVVKPTGVPYHWNFYCNNLKERVHQGWFFYLDDDDYLVDSKALERIAQYLIDPSVGIICQFNRGYKPKPDSLVVRNHVIDPTSIIRGKIGGSCIFLHHSKKDIAHWDGQKAADYRFIRAVSEKIPLVFAPVVVVQAGNNGRHGR